MNIILEILIALNLIIFLELAELYHRKLELEIERLETQSRKKSLPRMVSEKVRNLLRRGRND